MKASLTVAAAALVAVAAAQDDSCRYHNDGSCDEPRYCHTGTDCTDCHSCGGGGGDLGFYGLSAIDIEGNRVSFAQYHGQVSLVVNVAQFWGLTDSESGYMGMVHMADQYEGQDFNILAFPCNQFAEGDPNTNSVIEAFAGSKYSEYGTGDLVSHPGAGHTQARPGGFPMFAKSTVNEPMCTGPRTDCVGSSDSCCSYNNPVYEYLKTNVGISDGLDAVHSDIDWNFAKFLVARDGTVVKRFHSHGTNPTNMGPDIVAQLAVAAPGGGASGGGSGSSGTGNAECWGGAYTFGRCCSGRGDNTCWSGIYNHAYCCAPGGGGH